MRIPETSATIPNVRLVSNRLEAPAGAEQPIRDLVTLANRELEAMHRFRQEVLALDGSSRDQDGRPGCVTTQYHKSEALGGVVSAAVVESDSGLLRAETGVGSANAARIVDKNGILSSGLWSLPGRAPGLTFRLTPSQSGDLCLLETSFSRQTMAAAASKGDLLTLLAEVPDDQTFKTSSLRTAIASASAPDLLRLDAELSSRVSQASERHQDGLAYGLLLTPVSLAVACLNPLLGAAVAALGLGAGYALARRGAHQVQEGYETLGNLRALGSWLETHQSELPPSWGV